MAKVIANHTVKHGGEYHPPGSELDLKGDMLKYALEEGVVRRSTPEDRPEPAVEAGDLLNHGAGEGGGGEGGDDSGSGSSD